ncbi:hypothetical protein C1646_676759 [Rhizophagus diaphanus]|nr:hypothetical protein C1646_676759 [Rhizophagus diaphanus] [Rhizophagus sp. MUCL 43196]
MDNDLIDLNIKWIKPLRKDRLFSIIHNTCQPQNGKIFHLAPNKETVLAKLWDWARQISSLPSEKRTSASLICHLRKDMQGIVHALKTDFPELRIKEYHGKSDLNKNVLTVRLWVTYMLEKFCSWHLFGWRMVNFFKEAEEISDVSNATIVNRETAEFLENKLRKTLEEMRSLDWHHIVECYGILPESLTKDFISKYENYNHMK